MSRANPQLQPAQQATGARSADHSPSWRRLVSELTRFLGVGAVATVVTIGLFNLLVHWGAAPLGSAPLTAYALSFLAGTAVAFTGNRYWVFSRRHSGHHARAFAAFTFLNALALVIPLLTLGLSRNVLGLHSFWADNISANGVGLVLATAFRFWAYRRWVFVGRRQEDAHGSR